MNIEIYKKSLQDNLTEFILTDNLFKLVEVMRIGAGILEKEGFPMKEWSIYKYKMKRYGNEKRLN